MVAASSSIFETEQYLFLDNATASSAALADTPPPTWYLRWMWVKTLGDSVARSATAETINEVSGSRFLRRIETTSTEVHPHRAISTSSIGLAPARCAESPSMVT